jgi:hypothetical protein
MTSSSAFNGCCIRVIPVILMVQGNEVGCLTASS